MISVIIPTYNRSSRILSSLESVLNQTYSDIEILIVDDGSTDDTPFVINKIKDPRIKFIRYEHNQGACHARNVGIAEAKGEYIAFHDSDDIWRPDKLKCQLEDILSSKADLVLCKIEVHKADEKIEYYPEINQTGFVEYETILSGGVGSTQTFFAKSEVFKNIQFDEAMPRSQDTEVLIRIAQKYKVMYLNKVLCIKYDQYDSLTKNIQNMVIAQELMLSKYEEDFNKYPTAKAVHLNALANAKALMGEKTIRERKIAFSCDHSAKNLIKLIFSLVKFDKFLIRG